MCSYMYDSFILYYSEYPHLKNAFISHILCTETEAETETKTTVS